MGLAAFFRFFTGMQAIVDMFLALAPEFAILMPIIRFLLRVLQSPIQFDITNPSNLPINFIPIIKAQKTRQLNNLIPDPLGELNHFLLPEIDIFYTDATVTVDGFEDVIFSREEMG